MVPKVRCIALVCALLLSLSALRVSAAVDWTDELDDPASDVQLDYGETVPGMGEVDIRHVAIDVEGSELNVTLLLGASYNASALYTVVLMADGSKDYTFMRMPFLGHTATGPSGKDLSNVSGAESGNGMTVYWKLPQADIDVTTKLEVDSANTHLTDASNITDPKYYADSAGSSAPPPEPDDGEEAGPTKVEFTYELEKVNRIKQTVVLHLTGNQSKYLRKTLDTNKDGTVTAAERDDYIGDREEDMSKASTNSNITLDGMAQTSQTGSIEKSAEMLGSTNSTTAIPIRMSTTILFPEPDVKKKEHEYKYVKGGSGTSGFENVTNDSVLKFIAPSGWKFDSDGWPASVKPYISKDGTKIVIEGKDWDTALPPGTNITDFTIVKKTGGGDDSPGAGAALLVAAAAAAAVVADRWRRRPRP